MIEDNNGKIYFERGGDASKNYFNNEVDYKFFAQETDSVEMEIESNLQED